MKKNREEILNDTLRLLQQLADDWEYGRPVDESTYFVADLGFESLDVVILSTQVQEHYDQVLPFTQFFEEIGQREVKDVTVGEWVRFIYEHLDEVPEQTRLERV